MKPILTTTRSLLVIPQMDLKHNLKQYAIMRKQLTKGERNER